MTEPASAPRIVAVLTDPATARACLSAAEAAAAAVGSAAPVEAFHPRPTPESLIMPSEEVMTDARRKALEAMLDERSRAVRRLVAEWGAAAAAGRAAPWNEVVGDSVEAAVAARGRTADLLVLARPAEDEGDAALHAAIFDTGRPFLLAPPGLVGGATPAFGRHLAIAWKASEQASRAVAAALPWLARAERVSLLTVGKPDAPPAAPDDAMAMLAGHGLKAVPVLLQRGADSVGAQLLRKAHAIGADAMIMGAYRHSRLLEIILGGVTRHMLQAADLPVFMMH